MADAPWKDAEPCALDEAAVSRIADNVSRRGPALVKRGRRIEQAKVAGTIAGACAALGLAWLLARPEPAVEPPALACAGFAPAHDLDLGVRGVAVVDGEAKLKTALPCRTVFELERGRITIHARNLGGGELRVVAGQDEVVVWGTLFSVERAEEATVVSTDEGVVEVIGRGKVTAGTRARFTVTSVTHEALDAAGAARLERAVGLIPETVAAPEPPPPPPPPPPPARARAVRKRHQHASALPPPPPPAPPSVDALIARAQAARKRGELDVARRDFREAGSRTGPTAEAAWLGLARLELDARRPRAALAAIEARAKGFPGGQLALEAAWLEVRALDEDGDRSRAEDAARALIGRWPDSVQARLAQRFLKKE